MLAFSTFMYLTAGRTEGREPRRKDAGGGRMLRERVRKGRSGIPKAAVTGEIEKCYRNGTTRREP